MTCDSCASRGFELVGVEPGGVVCLRCDRCGRVERVVADPRPRQQATGPRSRYRDRRELQDHGPHEQRTAPPV